MNKIAVSGASLVYGALIGAILLYFTGFYDGDDWVYLLVGVAIASSVMWFFAAIVIGRRSIRMYLIFGLLSPALGLPFALYIASLFEGGLNGAVSNLFGVIGMMFYLWPVAVILAPFGILMGWINGTIMRIGITHRATASTKQP